MISVTSREGPKQKYTTDLSAGFYALSNNLNQWAGRIVPGKITRKPNRSSGSYELKDVMIKELGMNWTKKQFQKSG